jgi:glycosyltransferase involved in cell wall biosynthesis
VVAVSLPTFSVLLGNYNKGAYIEGALQAIWRQSLRPDEIIIIDDCSTDNSAEIIREILKKNPEIRFIQNERNMGTCYTLDRIVREASCDYFHLVGTDDIVLPGFYEKSMRLLSKYPEAGLCSGIAQCQDVEGKDLNLNPSPPYVSKTDCFVSPDNFLNKYKKYGNWYNGAVTFWRREPYLASGGFAPAELGSLTDTFKFYQLALQYGACFIPEVLHTWTVISSSFSARARLDRNLALNLIERTEEVMSKDPDDLFPSEFIKEFKRQGLISVANISIENSHFEMLRALEYNENSRPDVSGWDRLFLALLKSLYKVQYFFTILHFNFNLARYLRKWKWRLNFLLKNFIK